MRKIFQYVHVASITLLYTVLLYSVVNNVYIYTICQQINQMKKLEDERDSWVCFTVCHEASKLI